MELARPFWCPPPPNGGGGGSGRWPEAEGAKTLIGVQVASERIWRMATISEATSSTPSTARERMKRVRRPSS